MHPFKPSASCTLVNLVLRLLFSLSIVFLVACNPEADSDDDTNEETAQVENGAGENDSNGDDVNDGSGDPGDNPVVAQRLAGDIDIFIGAQDNRLVADGSSTSAIRVQVFDTDGVPLTEQELSLTLSAGSLSEASGKTNEHGVFETSIAAPDHLATGLLQGTSDGVSSEPVKLHYVAGPAVAENSLINVSPSSLPADGEGEAEVVVLLIDENGHLLPDGEEVTLLATDGVVVSDNPAEIRSGRASFTIRAPDSAGQAELSLREMGDLVSSMTFGAATSDEVPASIRTHVREEQLYVTGLGQRDTTTLTVEVDAADGNPLNEEGLEENVNVRLEFLTAPNGGEELLWLDDEGDLQSAALGETLEIITSNGVAQLNLRTGSKPGIIEIKAEAIDPDGDSYEPEVISIMQQVAVTSGPPHTIAVSLPNTDAVINLNEANPSTPGFYRRRGGLIVTDRWGNAVPDGTVIQLGLVDSVIVSGEAAADTNEDSSALQLSGVDLQSDHVMASDVHRFVEPGDRVLLSGAPPEDKVRFVSEINDSVNLEVQQNYRWNGDNLDFLIGASLLGAKLDGVSASGESMLGHVVTRDGLAEIAMTYPARTDVMFTQVWAVLSSSESKATKVFDGFQFSAISDFTLEASPSRLSEDGSIDLVVRDGGDGVALPNQPVSYAITTDMADDAVITVTAGNTGEDAKFSSNVTITDAESGDSATITYMAPSGAETEVEITIP